MEQDATVAGLRQLLTHLEQQRGWISRSADELCVRYASWPAADEDRVARNDQVRAVYSEPLGRLLHLLPPGDYGHRGLAQFFTGIV